MATYMEKGVCTVIMCSTYNEDQKETICFVDKLRKRLGIRTQTAPEERIKQVYVDTTLSKWINKSHVTVLVLTRSFANAAWVPIFNEGRFAYDARSSAGETLIPVIMPMFPKKKFKTMFGTHMVLVHEPFTFVKKWQSDESMWKKFAKIIKSVARNPTQMEINLVEFTPDMKYAIRNRTLPGKNISQHGSLQLAFYKYSFCVSN